MNQSVELLELIQSFGLSGLILNSKVDVMILICVLFHDIRLDIVCQPANYAQQIDKVYFRVWIHLINLLKNTLNCYGFCASMNLFQSLNSLRWESKTPYL